jgi:outer membrane protein OmpA-like peptidoglycan-associated protein
MNKTFTILCLSLACLLLFSCSVRKKKSTYMNKTYNELKTNFPEAQVTIVHDSIKVIFPNNVLFEIGASDVKSGFDEKLNRFAGIINKYDKTNLLITGYTDNSGEIDKNLKLSLDRAENVKKKLLSNQVKEKRLFTWGLGEKNPISSNETEEGKAKNRRVEFVVLYKPN